MKEQKENEKTSPEGIKIGQKVSTAKRGSKDQVIGTVKTLFFDKRNEKWFCSIETEDGTSFHKRTNKVTAITE